MTHTTEPTIDEIFEPILADIGPMGTTSGEFARLTDEAKQAIQALIDRECTKARIEALSSLLENEDGCICQLADQKVCDHNWSLCNTVREKIAELSNKEVL